MRQIFQYLAGAGFLLAAALGVKAAVNQSPAPMKLPLTGRSTVTLARRGVSTPLPDLLAPFPAGADSHAEAARTTCVLKNKTKNDVLFDDLHCFEFRFDL